MDLFSVRASNNPFPKNLTLPPFERTLPPVMKDYSKTIADAQAFIDSVQKFNGGKDELNRDRPSSDGSDPLGGTDSTLQGNIAFGGRLQVSNSIPPKHSSYDHNHDGPDPNTLSPPVGYKNISFSRKQEYDNPFRADLITYIEVYYYENKRLPDIHVLHEHFRDHPERPNFLKGWNSVLDSVSDSLSNRGIKPYNTVENYIDPKFAWATSLIVNHLDKRTIPAKLKEAGLTTKEWQAFLRRKRHFDYFQSRLDEVFDQDVKNDAKLALARSIQNGDLQAIKYYNELKNIYRPETQNAMQMVSIVLTAVMEILAQHVTSDTLNRVAAEIRTSPSVRKIIEAQAS